MIKLGERASFRQIYIRWATVLILLGIVGALTVGHYYQEVVAISPEELLRIRPEGTVRIWGRVASGTLTKGTSEASFKLSGEPFQETATEISVHYVGKQDDNLRERKLLVLRGFFDPGKMEFTAQTIALPPHYGFIVSAYLFALIPLALFAFYMERKVLLLSILIKEEKGYQPEIGVSAEKGS